MSEEKQARILRTTKLAGYKLLNNEKLGRVLDLIEGVAETITESDRAALRATSKLSSDDQIIALYDRIGGGIKTLEGRKVAIGTFWNFKTKLPNEGVELDESDFEDEVVIQKKKTKKSVSNETEKDRIARLEARSGGKVEKTESEEEESEESGDESPKKTAKKTAKKSAK